MPNDAKLGLVVGMALVLLIAVLFFRREPTAASENAAIAASGTPAMLTSGERRGVRPP